jgi:hypothetical protein
VHSIAREVREEFESLQRTMVKCFVVLLAIEIVGFAAVGGLLVARL